MKPPIATQVFDPAHKVTVSATSYLQSLGRKEWPVVDWEGWGITLTVPGTIHIQESRGALAKEHATAATTKSLSKETMMSQSIVTVNELTRYSTDEILTELDSRGCDVPLWLRPVGPKVQPGSVAHLVLFRFNKARIDAGFSQAEIARRTGIPASSLREALNGDAAMGFNQYLRICRALNLSIVDTLRPEEGK